MSGLIRVTLAVSASVFLFTVVLGVAPASAEEGGVEDAILKEKCGLCHSSKRYLTMDKEQLKPVLERMQKKNPDWITDIERKHIAEVLAEVLGRPEILSIRKAWSEAVERGSELFADPSVGTNGKACTDCHARLTMRQVTDSYPQYDLELRRVITIDDRVRLMITDQLEGKLQTLGDQRLIDLIAYLKSLY